MKIKLTNYPIVRNDIKYLLSIEVDFSKERGFGRTGSTQYSCKEIKILDGEVITNIIGTLTDYEQMKIIEKALEFL